MRRAETAGEGRLVGDVAPARAAITPNGVATHKVCCTSLLMTRGAVFLWGGNEGRGFGWVASDHGFAHSDPDRSCSRAVAVQPQGFPINSRHPPLKLVDDGKSQSSLSRPGALSRKKKEKKTNFGSHNSPSPPSIPPSHHPTSITPGFQLPWLVL